MEEGRRGKESGGKRRVAGSKGQVEPAGEGTREKGWKMEDGRRDKVEKWETVTPGMRDWGNMGIREEERDRTETEVESRTSQVVPPAGVKVLGLWRTRNLPDLGARHAVASCEGWPVV